MFTEAILRQNPGMIKAFMGIPAEVFWMIVEVVERVLPEVDRIRLERSDRKRQPGQEGLVSNRLRSELQPC